MSDERVFKVINLLDLNTSLSASMFLYVKDTEDFCKWRFLKKKRCYFNIGLEPLRPIYLQHFRQLPALSLEFLNIFMKFMLANNDYS